MTREEYLELCLLSLHESLLGELYRRGHPGGLQAGVPRLGQLPLSVLQEWERDIRHAIECPQEWWSKVEAGEREEWLQSKPLALTDEAREAMVDLEMVRRLELGLFAEVVYGDFRRELRALPLPERPSPELTEVRVYILRVGGVTPAMRVQLVAEPGQPKVSFQLSETRVAQQVGKHLYQEVDVVALVQRDHEGKIEGGTVQEWYPVSSDNPAQTWREWFRANCADWTDVEDLNKELGR